MALFDKLGLNIPVVVDDKTAKGITSAKKNISLLEKNINKLGASVAVAFSTDAIVNFGKEAIAEFAKEQKSVAALTQTVKNLGLSFADANIETFVTTLSSSAGIAKDTLRPALQKLLQTTGQVIRSQELLKTAIDVSRGSGVDLQTVVSDLSNAYVGNNKGLKKYALGLTAAELKTASFDKVLTQFQTNFSGQSSAYLKTYAGQMQLLATAATDAKEAIGKGLIDSLNLLAKDHAVQNISDAMLSFSNYVSNSIYGVSVLASKLGSLKAPDWLKSLLGKSAGAIASQLPGADQIKTAVAGLNYIEKLGEKAQNAKLQNPSVAMFLSDEANTRTTAADLKKFQDSLLKIQKGLTAEQKKQALLKKQGTLFDIQQIELVAALKGKLSDDERKRVELQLALLQGNEEAAAKLSTEIANSIDKTGNLAKYLQTLPDANNPFKNWDAYITALEERIKKLNLNPPSPENPSNPSTPSPLLPATPVTKDYSGFSYDPSNVGQSGSGAQYGSQTPWAQAAAANQTLQINLQADGKTLASYLANLSASGVNSSIDRNLGYFTN